MSSMQRGYAVQGLWLAVACVAAHAQVEYRKVEQAVIEQRLEQTSAKNHERQDRLAAMFEVAGCKDKLTLQPVGRFKSANVICVLPGSEPGEIIVGAHFDQVVEGHGVVDNWSGAALLPSLFESLKTRPRRHTYVFIGFCEEEKGLIGSRSYVKQLTAEQKARIRAMVNLDTLGLGPLQIWVARADQRLVQVAAAVAGVLQLPLTGMNVDQAGTTDSESFRAAGIATITFHTVTKETWPILHSRSDNINAIKRQDYYDGYRFLAVYLAHLDAALKSKPAMNVEAK